MITLARAVLALVMGVLAAITTYWIGAVAALLAMRGVPLGSPGGPASTPELAVHLILGTGAGFVGAIVAARIAIAPTRRHAFVVTMALGLILGATALLSFSNVANQWPVWFGAALGAALALGTLMGGHIAEWKR